VVDLHTHILPGIDDGPADMDGSLVLARELAAEGVETVAATPHLRGDHPGVVVGELAARTAALGERLAEAGVPLAVVPAAEVSLEWAQEATDAELGLASFDQRGTDVLVETPYEALTDTFEEMIFGIMLRGFRILLAHPERSVSFQRDIERLEALVGRGVVLQVTADAVTGSGRRSPGRRLGSALLRSGLAAVLASDAHGHTRRASLATGVAAARRLAPARAEWMATAAPAAILAGEPLGPPPEPDTGHRVRLLGRRRG